MQAICISNDILHSLQMFVTVICLQVDRTDQPLLMTKSRTASCAELKNAREGYEQLKLKHGNCQ